MSSTHLLCKISSCKISPNLIRFALNYKGKRVQFSKPIYTCQSLIHKNGLMLSTPSFLPSPNKDRKHPSSIPFAKFEDNDSESNKEEDEKENNRALEAVLGLYSSLRNKDVQGVANVLSEECRCMSNFISPFKPLQGKQQVLEFLTALMGIVGEHVHIVVKPTLHNGLAVGLAWSFECTKTHVPLGKGFGFYMCHEYYGKILIRNVEMFMEPLVSMEPLRLKLIPLFVAVIMSIPGSAKLTGRLSKGVYGLLGLLLMAMSLFFFKLSVS